MEKLNLKNVTLFCYENRPEYIDKAIESINICKYYADFGDIKFVTNKQIDYEHCVVDDFQINTLTDYSKFILTKLNGYVNNEFVLTVHHDGFITSKEAFKPEFLSYDYLGATWYFEGQTPTVGNGGVSIRSKKLLNCVNCAIEIFGYPSKQLFHPHEDIVICKILRPWLEQNGCKFGSVELCDSFSVETKRKWSENVWCWHGASFIDIYKDGWKNPLKNNSEK